MPKKILVIDDEGLVTKSLCGLLEKSGYSAEPSKNGFDAIDKIKDTHIDLIVVDVRMPGIDGVETVKRIRELLSSKNRPNIPVIFITGYPDCEASLKAKELGEVIVKPFNTEELLNRINNYI